MFNQWVLLVSAKQLFPSALVYIHMNFIVVTISVGAGTVSDCWSITERGVAFSVLFVGQFFGPLIGTTGLLVHAVIHSCKKPLNVLSTYRTNPRRRTDNCSWMAFGLLVLHGLWSIPVFLFIHFSAGNLPPRTEIQRKFRDCQRFQHDYHSRG